MSVTTSITAASQTVSANGPDGASDPPSSIDDAIRYALSFIAMLRDGDGYGVFASVASAATVNLNTSGSINVDITGTTAITAITLSEGRWKLVRFGGALTLTNGASLTLPGNANITTAAGDFALFVGRASGVVSCVFYQRASVPPGGSLLNIQIFTASGTYTPTAGTNSVRVRVQGGGGGSGGHVATTAATNWAAGRPGAAGAYAEKRITSGFSGVTVTVGAGGTAGTAGDNSGGTGGTSSFGALVSCTGGAGGGGSGSAQTTASVTLGTTAAGGAATGGDINVPGASPGSNFSVSASIYVKAAGANSVLGNGGAGAAIANNNTGSQVGGGYGAGASGAASSATTAATAGAAGSPGIVIVEEYS